LMFTLMEYSKAVTPGRYSSLVSRVTIEMGRCGSDAMVAKNMFHQDGKICHIKCQQVILFVCSS